MNMLRRLLELTGELVSDRARGGEAFDELLVARRVDRARPAHNGRESSHEVDDRRGASRMKGSTRVRRHRDLLLSPEECAGYSLVRAGAHRVSAEVRNINADCS
jgi:hypothetical protein